MRFSLTPKEYGQEHVVFNLAVSDHVMDKPLLLTQEATLPRLTYDKLAAGISTLNQLWSISEEAKTNVARKLIESIYKDMQLNLSWKTKTLK
jgi:hypothetical protein